MARSKTSILRVLKPIVAGLAVAYLVTAFMDKPAPVHFQPENPYAAKQEEIVSPQDELVTERNIMKLGSPLSVSPDVQLEVPTENPLAVLENETDSGKSDAEETQKGVAEPQPEVRQDVEVEPVEPAPDESESTGVDSGESTGSAPAPDKTPAESKPASEDAP